MPDSVWLCLQLHADTTGDEMKTLLARSMNWDNQFTYKIHQLQPDQAAIRVSSAWLAGYNACLDARKRKKAQANRSSVK